MLLYSRCSEYFCVLLKSSPVAEFQVALVAFWVIVAASWCRVLWFCKAVVEFSICNLMRVIRHYSSDAVCHCGVLGVLL